MASIAARLPCWPAAGQYEALQACVEHTREVIGQDGTTKVCSLLRDVFGGPSHPPPRISPSVLQWHGGLIQRLAEAAYQHRLLPSGHLDPERLGVLADALEEAGADAEMVAHLRGPGMIHVRGCYLVDLFTGRE